MLIIGKKRDYYDGVVDTMGVDKTIVYNREQLEFTGDEMPIGFRHSGGYFSDRGELVLLKLDYFSIKRENKNKHQYSSYFIVGFCGKLYVGWKFYKKIKDDDITIKISYDFDYVKLILDNKNWRNGNIVDSYNDIINYDAMPLFRKLNTPIFIYDSDFNRTSIEKYHYKTNPKLIVNSTLKDYEFYRIFDSFTAFQEIQMFMGGVLGVGEKPMVVVADKYKIAQHGFDKWSFRKEKEIK